MPDVVMPRLSDSMEHGTIVKWLVDDGTVVVQGTPLAEIETDKATMTYEAEGDGAATILIAEGATVAVGEVIARLGAGAEGPSGPAHEATVDATDATHARDASPVASARLQDGAERARRVVASPLARRLAAEQNVALSDIAGTGANGRIRRADVEGAIAARNATSDAPVPRPSAIDLTSTAIGEQQAAANGGKGETQRVELTRLQVTVARRMAEAKATVPEFSVTRTINVGPVLAFRRELKTAIEPPPSFNDLIVKACALALREHPKVNGSYRDGAFDLYSRVNIGVAVASEDALVVPTVFDADLLSLGAIAKETRRLAKLVRESRIAPPDLASGTFTVSNLGMHGIARFQAIINPPQAAILAVGAASKNDELDLTLSCDHRILYGTDAAGFLATVGQLLEEPLGLLG